MGTCAWLERTTLRALTRSSSTDRLPWSSAPRVMSAVDVWLCRFCSRVRLCISSVSSVYSCASVCVSPYDANAAAVAASRGSSILLKGKKIIKKINEKNYRKN
jgi:hypothetical protein